MREEFPLNSDLIYLNSANLSLCPRRILDEMNRYHLAFEQNPTKGLAEAWPMLWNAQGQLAKFLNADPGELFLRPNITATLNTFLLGMPLAADSEILVGELEYGAIVNICRLRAERDGLALRVLGMPTTPAALANYDEDKLLAEIVGQIGPKTSLMLLSHIVAGNGIRLPVERLAAITRKRGILLAVDGAYAPGAIPINFASLRDVDFYGCSLYKWMMGAKGSAFGWIPRRHHDALQPLNAGWSTYDIQGPIGHYGNGSRFQARMLMAGCHDFAPFAAIPTMIEFWNKKGPSTIRDRMAALRRLIDETMRQRLPAWTPLVPRDPALRGGMCLFQIPKSIDGAALMGRMLEVARTQINTVCLRGVWYLSLSPHVYNDEAEITEAITRLATLF
jgi:selenocysteine lyase/cysteine desulfurase